MESVDVGKPLSQARTDVIVCARYFEYYGGVADNMATPFPSRTGSLP
jgi:aldehyde dehydrogenase (NAD+)